MFLTNRNNRSGEDVAHLCDAVVLFSKVFELGDPKSYEANAKRPFGLKKLLTGLV